MPNEPAEKGGLPVGVKLLAYVSCWYFFNVQYNLVNKTLLNAFPAYWVVSWVQMCSGIPISLLMWRLKLVVCPEVTKGDCWKLAPVGLAFAMGQVFTVAALGSVAVSFAHVVKAFEPAVNAVLSALMLGQVFRPIVYSTLLPIILGVYFASTSELSFTMFGFTMAMGSNFAFQTRNVLATKLGSVGDMGKDTTTRKTNQLAVLNAIAAAIVTPFVVVAPSGLTSISGAVEVAQNAGVSKIELGSMLLRSGFLFFMYQLASFWVLSLVEPITHSVLNTLKRVVIIVVSILVFGNEVTPRGIFGTSLAVAGVMCYSLAKKLFPNAPKALLAQAEPKCAVGDAALLKASPEGDPEHVV